MKPRVLIVDDEKNIQRTLGMVLRSEGYRVRESGRGEEALELLEESPADLVLLDVNLPGIDGIEVLKRIRARHPEVSVVLISGQATVAVAVEGTRAGAFDFLEKPLSKERVLLAVRNALAVERLSARVVRYESAEARRRILVGESAALERVRKIVEKAGPTAATVFITGESGTGKELVARALHDASPRRHGPFVKVNCAAIPEELIETELFGCVRGAYTGADRNRDGKFLLADGGTLFLDEIGDMSLKVQAKVLRALQEGEIERVGGAGAQRVDARVLAATNRDPVAGVKSGRFREDLFYRLNVVPIVVPPLRERREDIPALCRHFLELYALENELPVKKLTPGALAQLTERSWRGNIRELRNVLERLAILGDGPDIDEQDVETLVPMTGANPLGEGSSASLTAITPEAIQEAGGLAGLRRLIEERCVTVCLDRTHGNVSQAARWLGLERTNLHKKMQALGLEARPPRPSNEEPEEGGEA
jgi:two-component system nitrogen regulation response regulator NtrX